MDVWLVVNRYTKHHHVQVGDEPVMSSPINMALTISKLNMRRGLDRDNSLSLLMSCMPEQWRKHWHTAENCQCLSASCRGGLIRAGFTRREWLDWRELDRLIHDKT